MISKQVREIKKTRNKKDEEKICPICGDEFSMSEIISAASIDNNNEDVKFCVIGVGMLKVRIFVHSRPDSQSLDEKEAVDIEIE